MGLRRTGFGQDAMQSIQCVVGATLEVYLSATRELRPTPAKSHYVFNLRDVSRVVQGCSLARKESVDSKRFFVNLWTHEVSAPCASYKSVSTHDRPYEKRICRETPV